VTTKTLSKISVNMSARPRAFHAVSKIRMHHTLRSSTLHNSLHSLLCSALRSAGARNYNKEEAKKRKEKKAKN